VQRAEAANEVSGMDLQERLRDPALLIVDMQNDFVRMGAPLEVPDARATLPVHRRLIDAARRRGLPVIYTKFLSHQEYCLLWEWSPQCRPPTKCCWKGHHRYYEDASGELDCTDVVAEIYPEPGDPIIEKYGYGAFHETSLALHLHDLGVRSLLVTGTVTQICVEETAREAFHHGFRTTLVTDAVSSYAPDLHAATLRNFAMKFGWAEDSDTLLQRLA
jgi:nicotinamidase-related amidase